MVLTPVIGLSPIILSEVDLCRMGILRMSINIQGLADIFLNTTPKPASLLTRGLREKKATALLIHKQRSENEKGISEKRSHFLFSRMKFLSITLLVLQLSSCISPHNNFKAHMSHTVGESIDDRRSWAYPDPDRYLGSKVLKNGNIENEYKLQRTCRYFFEYDPETRIIVNWRFEGKEGDCIVNP